MTLSLNPNLTPRLAATCVSDCTANSIRVLKTARQTSEVVVSYRARVRVR